MPATLWHLTSTSVGRVEENEECRSGRDILEALGRQGLERGAGRIFDERRDLSGGFP